MGGGMWLQFFEQNMHFAVYMFTSLVFFAVAWLYLDAWLNGHAKKELLKWTGFGLVGASFLLQALIVEQSTLGNAVLGDGVSAIAFVIQLVGFAAILGGQVIDPLQAVPLLKGLYTNDEPAGEPEAATPVGDSTSATATHSSEQSPDDTPSTTTAARAWYAPVSVGAQALLPITIFVIAWCYYRRATTGLERHLKKVSFAFASYGVAAILQLLSHLRNTDNPMLFNWVRLYGPFWILQHVALLIGSLYLGYWVWSYLTKRFFSQLLMIFVLTIGTVFLIISIGFTGLLLRDIRSNALSNLEVSTQVLNYAFSAKQSEVTAAAEQIAGSAEINDAVRTKNHDKLVSLTKDYLATKKQSGLIITDSAGQVLVRADDAERWGDSLSSDPLIKRALLGIGKSGVVVDDGINVPTLQVRSAAVIRLSDGTIIGSATTSLDLDTAFVGGVKRSTGLDSALYAGDVLAATTRLGVDGKSSSVGAKLADQKVVDQVIKNGKPYSGRFVFANKDFLAAFVPVKDPDNVPVAILSVDRSESSILDTAGRSVELTFILTAVLLVLSIGPVYFITRNLVKQIR